MCRDQTLWQLDSLKESVPTPDDIKKWTDTAFELYDQKKYNEAFELFQQAVLEGSPVGDYSVGLCYLFGDGVGKDQVKGNYDSFQKYLKSLNQESEELRVCAIAKE